MERCSTSGRQFKVALACPNQQSAQLGHSGPRWHGVGGDFLCAFFFNFTNYSFMTDCRNNKQGCQRVSLSVFVKTLGPT